MQLPQPLRLLFNPEDPKIPTDELRRSRTIAASASAAARYFTKLPYWRIDPEYGFYHRTRACSVGAHLGYLLQASFDQRQGIEAWARTFGGNTAHAVLLLREAGAGHDPFGPKPWALNPADVFTYAATVEELPEITGADFHGIRLDIAHLRGVDFSGAFLRKASFFGCDLRLARFTDKADARSADFRSANLEDADFTAADVRKAHFGRAYLANTRFEGARLEGAQGLPRFSSERNHA